MQNTKVIEIQIATHKKTQHWFQTLATRTLCIVDVKLWTFFVSNEEFLATQRRSEIYLINLHRENGGCKTRDYFTCEAESECKERWNALSSHNSPLMTATCPGTDLRQFKWTPALPDPECRGSDR